MPDSTDSPILLSCMEVWGGNDATSRHLQLRGLDAWVFSEVYGHQGGGGDVYHVSSCATGRITRLLLADVSGHGPEVSAPAGRLRQLMQRHVNQIDQRRLVRELNSAFAESARHGLFATAVVASYFAPTRVLTLTSAGHPPPLLYRRRSDSWSCLALDTDAGEEVTGIPLGVLARSEYDQHFLRLQPGDLVLCYTDALIECRDEDGRSLGSQGLRALLQGLDATRPERLVPALVRRLRALHPGNLEQDDQTALLFTPNTTGDEEWLPGLKHHLVAMGRMLRAMVNPGEPVPWPDLHPANLGGSLLPVLNRLWGRGVEPGPGQEP